MRFSFTKASKGLAFQVLLVGAVSSLAIADTVEVVDLDAFQKTFEVPQDSKDFEVVGLVPKKKIAVERTTVTRDGCNEDFDDPVGYCETSTTKYESAFATEVRFRSDSNFDSETHSSQLDLVVNFRPEELGDENIANLPKVKWFGKGLSKNYKFAREVLVLSVENKTRIERVVDEANSEYCDRDVDTYDPYCEDKIVYMDAPVTRRYLTVSVKK